MSIDPILARALLASFGVALAAAPLGCFVLWRRMAYFGDATAHSGVLGVALALGLGLPLLPGVLIAALAMALLVLAMSRRGLAEDTVLGVLAHGSLAVGLVAMSLLPGRALDLEAFLLGDILSVRGGDLSLIWAGAVAVAAFLARNWSALVLATLDRGLATAAGFGAARLEVALVAGIAIVVAVAIKIVGVLLIAGLSLIPAAAARPLARTPEGMAGLAVAAGLASCLAGLMMSWFLDTPPGPSIVSGALAIFAATHIWAALRGHD